MTQQTLANRVGMSLSAIQGLESDRHEPSLGTILKVTRELKANFEVEESGKVIGILYKGPVKL